MKWRIVTDSYLGFEVQWRPWWWPFWMPRCNTHPSEEKARKWAEQRRSGRVVAYL